MSSEFERQKNIKASAYTLGIAGALLLFLMFVRMTTQAEVKQPEEQYIEINLGSGDEGSGTDQPQLPGEPAPAEQTAYVPPQPTRSVEESVRDVEANETSRDAPPIIKPTVTKPNATKINNENRTVRSTPTTQPVTAPPEPRPRAVMGQVRGGNGTGGNGADTY
ncbi:MAG TPA: hypothetical protein VM368_05000, partial [Flavisolibacter sp.]|nr:hypothetical protein [Flavisolibacter sp.]